MILFLLGTIAVQTVGDVFGGFIIACSRDRLTGVGDDFLLFCTDWEIFRLKRFIFGHCILPRLILCG